MKEQIFEIDGNDFSNLMEFCEITVSMGLLDRLGKESDALNDAEHGLINARQRCILIWRNSHLSRERFGKEATISWLEERAQKGEQVDVEEYKKRFANSEGGTLFDTIVEGLEVLLKGGRDDEIEIRYE